MGLAFRDEAVQAIMAWGAPSAGHGVDYSNALAAHLRSTMNGAEVTPDASGISIRRRRIRRGGSVYVATRVELATQGDLDQLLGQVSHRLQHGERVVIAIIGYYDASLVAVLKQRTSVREFADLLGLPLCSIVHVPRSPDVPVEALLNLALDRLHERVLSASKQLFLDGHYAQAIFEAFKGVEVAVREQSGLHDAFGRDLMLKAFSEKDPRINVMTHRNKSGENEQEGFKFLFAGAIAGIRNPKGHDFIEQRDPQRAFEYLAFASILLRRLDEAKAATETAVSSAAVGQGTE